MNIDEMPAGPKMDALIAEILGYDILGIVRCFPDPEYVGYYLPYREIAEWQIPGTELRPVYLNQCVCEFAEPEDRNYFGHIAGCLEIVKEYSSDIAAAWEVVEKLGELTGKDVLVEHCADGDRMCTTGRHYRGLWMKDVQAVAPTVPLAICRAAYRAVKGLPSTRPSLATAILSSLPNALQGKLESSK